MAASAAVILILKEKYRVCNIQNLKFDLPKLAQPSNLKPQSTTSLCYGIENILFRKNQLPIKYKLHHGVRVTSHADFKLESCATI